MRARRASPIFVVKVGLQKTVVIIMHNTDLLNVFAGFVGFRTDPDSVKWTSGVRPNDGKSSNPSHNLHMRCKAQLCEQSFFTQEEFFCQQVGGLRERKDAEQVQA